MSRTVLRALGLVTALALAVPAAAALPASADEAGTPHRAAAARTAPSISLWAPAAVTAYGYRHTTWTDLGLRIIAVGAPIEIWAQRPSYDEGIQAVWKSPEGDVTLPATSMTSFSGLDKFVTLRILATATGQQVTLHRDACLNGPSQRVRPDAPATSPYPYGCRANPFSLGAVQGVQEGWSSPILAPEKPLRVGPGEYTVIATINHRYATVLGLTPSEATRTIALTVNGETGPPAPDRSGRSTPRTGGHRPAGPQGRADGPVPDLRALPAWSIAMSESGNQLRFAATVWNAGDSPMVVDGFRREGEDEMDAYQYFFDAAGNQTGYQAVGHLHWDPKPSHQHWHFEDFARYSLLDADQVEAARSKKEAFCLANTDAVDLTVPDARWQPQNTDLATSCGDYSALSIREVLATGWGDTYMQYRAGQAFNLRGLPNGTYYIAVIANPEHRLVEASLDNNVSLREVEIGGTEGNRTVTVPQVGIIDEEVYGGTG